MVYRRGFVLRTPECDLRINFTKTLETIGKSSSLNSSDLQKRLLLCIFGIGSNTGLKRISIANDGINYSDLRYVKKRHVNAVNIRNAIRILVNNVLKIRDPDVWGEATTTVACDSTHLFAWDQNLMSEWHFPGSAVRWSALIGPIARLSAGPWRGYAVPGRWIQPWR